MQNIKTQVKEILNRTLVGLNQNKNYLNLNYLLYCIQTVNPVDEHVNFNLANDLVTKKFNLCYDELNKLFNSLSQLTANQQNQQHQTNSDV